MSVGWSVGRLVRNQSLLVGGLVAVECIDCSAEVAVVEAVASGIGAATTLAVALGVGELRRPWVMVSVNVDEDPHFRKASKLLCRCLPLHSLIFVDFLYSVLLLFSFFPFVLVFVLVSVFIIMLFLFLFFSSFFKLYKFLRRLRPGSVSLRVPEAVRIRVPRSCHPGLADTPPVQSDCPPLPSNPPSLHQSPELRLRLRLRLRPKETPASKLDFARFGDRVNSVPQTRQNHSNAPHTPPLIQAYTPSLLTYLTPGTCSGIGRQSQGEGVVAERCYGCGRCLPVCPVGLISKEGSHIPENRHLYNSYRIIYPMFFGYTVFYTYVEYNCYFM